MEEHFFCAVRGGKVHGVECAGIICKADAACLEVCRDCSHGKALASTARAGVERVAQSLEHSAHHHAMSMPQESMPTTNAWDIIKLATGCNTRGKLAKLLGISDCNVKVQVQRLIEGKLPRRDNTVIPAILRLGKLTLQDLIPGAPHIEFLKHARVEQPVEAECSEQADGGEREAALARFDAAASTMGVDMTPPLTLMGADPSEQLPTAGELSALRQGNADAQNLPTAPVSIPVGFVFYDDNVSSDSAETPQLRFDKRGDITISPAAVQAFGLENAERVRIGWFAEARQFGILPGYTGPGSRKVQIGKKGCRSRNVNTRMAVRKLGINPAPGAYPLTRDPSGLLVATINQQPAQGGEA